ncbi:SCO family protein [Aquabacterium sp.]|uniref:SCO family protein n=1 Tax=Aquabacterium sp. TaxID=1872578 RepID=UPI00248A0659|nr:SCO family protein [Aquabacterium sp.]MDI1259678.1 SCO family protein [Aquabacterium sp.]
MRSHIQSFATLACGLTLASSVFLAGCDRSSSESTGATGSAKEAAVPAQSTAFKSVDITGADYAKQFSLVDFDGKKRTLSDFKGKVVFVFFGFTQCPEVCPTTMAELAEVKRRLGKDGDRVQGVFITIDPERDTAEVLKAYLTGMDPSFIGLRGSLDEVNAVSREFKVFYQKVPTKDGAYTMDHTAGGFVFDPSGQVRLFARYGLGVDALTSDIQQLLASSSSGG